MQKKLNEDFIDSYCEKFAAKVTSTFFTDGKETISGKEVLSITPSKQANFFIVKLIFRYWQAESKKLESPFFNYKQTEVKEALIEFMNVLSQHIEVHKNNFQLLLNHAVKDTIYLAAAPEAYIEIDLEARGVDTITEKAITGTLKYVRLYKKEIEDFLSDMKDLTIDDVIDEVAEQFDSFDSTPGLEQELNLLSEILPVKIDQVLTDDIPDDFDDEDSEVFDNDDDFFEPRKETAETAVEEKTVESEVQDEEKVEAEEEPKVEEKAVEEVEEKVEEEEKVADVKEEEEKAVAEEEIAEEEAKVESEPDEKQVEATTAGDSEAATAEEDEESDDEDDFFTPEKDSFTALDDEDDDGEWDNDDDFFTPRKASSEGEERATEQKEEKVESSDKIDWDDKAAAKVDEAEEETKKVESVFTGEDPEEVEEMEEEISEDDTPEVIPPSDEEPADEAAPVETVNDQFEAEAETVGEHHQNAKESTMMKLISVNHQYMFVKELFKDDQVSFQNALYELEEQTSFDGAVEYLVQSYAREFQWDMQSTEVKELLKVLFRKFRD